MDSDNQLIRVPIAPLDGTITHAQAKAEPVMENEDTMRSLALRNEQITETDVRVLVQKAKEMIESGTAPSPPKNRVRKGKRVRAAPLAH